MIKPNVTITTDGGCEPNPGAGAWAGILRFNQTTKTITGSHLQTTNNRMEMTAIIESLSLLTRRCTVTLRTDSMICIYAIRDKKRKKKRANMDLVHKLWLLIDDHDVTTEWVRGHDGDPDNEECDRLCADIMRLQRTQKAPSRGNE